MGMLKQRVLHDPWHGERGLQLYQREFSCEPKIHGCVFFLLLKVGRCVSL